MVIINSFREPESNLKCKEDNVLVIVDKNELGTGTLYVSERTLCWEGPNSTGFSLSYFDISMHAVTKDTNVYPRECLYIMVDGKLQLSGSEDMQTENNDSDDGSEADISEMLLVPENAGSIPVIFEAIGLCQKLNPDPEDVDDDDDNLYVDAEDGMDGDYQEHENRGGGDADVEELSRILQRNGVNVNYATNGHEEEEFEDAD